jgi:hypothetical protein
MKSLIPTLVLICGTCIAADSTPASNIHAATLTEVHAGFTSFVSRVKADLQTGVLPQPTTTPPSPGDIFVKGFGWVAPNYLDWCLTLKPTELKYAVQYEDIIAARIELEPATQPEGWSSDTPLKYELSIDRMSDGNWIPRTGLWCNAPSSPSLSEARHIEGAPIRIPKKETEITNATSQR